MERMGVRALKDGLSGVLRRVSAGAVVEVTDHGKVVARIVPADLPEHLAQLVADGTLTPPSRPRVMPDERDVIDLGPGPSLAELIFEDREDRV